jgi:phosphoribosylformimino-5-aminoimidazole carboxamide ribotide isomerase
MKFPQRIVLGIDAREGRVATHGWLETSNTSAVELAKQLSDLPLAALIYTDIATDGMLAGPNLAAMREMAGAVPLPVIASGGVTTVKDVEELVGTGVAGCIIGRALYEHKLSLADAIEAVEKLEATK